MRKNSTTFKIPTIRTALACAVFCATALCPAQETARGIVAEKIDSAKNGAERPEPEIRFQLGHSDGINSVAWSPDSRYIASGSADCTMKIWDAFSGRELHIIEDSKSVNSVSWSPDGRYIAIGSGDSTVKIWNVFNWQKIHTLVGHSSCVFSVSWSPDGKYIASGSEDGTIRVWDATSEKELRTLTGHSNCVNSVAWSPDGKYIASGSYDNMVKVWNAENGKEISTTDKISGDVHSVAWSPDGRYIASVGGDLHVWDANSGNEIFVISTEDYLLSVAWSPDGRYIASGDSWSDVRIWNVNSRKETHRFTEGWTTIYCPIAWSSNGKYIATGSTTGAMRILEVTSGDEICTPFGIKERFFSIACSPDSKCIAMGDMKGNLRVWNTSSGIKIHTLTGLSDWVSSINWSPDNRYIASGSYDGTIKVWDAASGKEMYTFEGHSGIVEYMVAWSPDGRYIASSSWDNTIRVWEASSGKEMRTLEGHSDSVRSVSWSPDSRYIVSGSDDGTIKVWNATSGKEMRTLTGISDWDRSSVVAVAWSPNSKYIASGNYDGTIKVWDATSGKDIHTFTVHVDHVDFITSVSCSWSPDSKYIASGSDRDAIRMWDIASGKEMRMLKWHSGYLRDMAWSLDGRIIASVNNIGIIEIWNAKSGALLCTIVNKLNYEGCSAFMGDEWLTYTPEGFFCGSEWATQNLVYIVDGMDVIGIDQVYDTYYRPDLVAAKMRGEDISAYASSVRLASLVRSGRAPAVSFSDIPTESSGRDMTFGISVRNTGGGIGAVNLLLNGKVIRLSDGVASADGGTISFRHTVTLQNGSNTIEAFALNGAGLVESVRSSAQVVWRGVTEKPDLYVLTAAINRYRDKSLWLNYAVPDAQSVAAGFQKQKSGLYRNVHVSQLNDGDVTKEKLAAEFSRLSQHIRADDVFVFFVSGHGTTYDDGDYYYLPVDFRYTSKDSIPTGGISKNDLLDSLSKIKAGKTLVMLDTCNSGAFLSDSNQRGLSEKTAIDRLTRATGHATLAASSDTQSAMEGYNGHGVFTYVFLEGIAGAADSDGDGYVTLNELSAFVEREVPERSYEKWGYEQIPQKDLRRQDFPIAGK